MPTVGEALQEAHALAAAGRLAEAEAIHRRLVELLPHAAETWAELGKFYLDAGRPDAAIEPLRRATGHDERNAVYHTALAAAYRATHHADEALAHFRRALEVGPRTCEALNNLALALRGVGRKDEALAAFDEALSLRPDYQTAHFNRARLLAGMGRLTEAVAGFETAIQLRPDDAGAHCMLGVAHYDQAQWDAALAAFERALELDPSYAEARRNRAMIRLLHEDYRRGWPEFEARLECDDIARRTFAEPRWDGSPLDGRTLFVYPEQGLGDTLQFVRYLPAAAAQKGGRVLFEPPEALRPLFVQSGLGEYLVPPGATAEFAVHASLISLAGHLPDGSGTPYWPGNYLSADPTLVARWSDRLRDVPGFKVGIAWAGNPAHPHDRYRSVRLSAFAPLAGLPGVQLVSLQKGAGREQLAESSAALSVLDFGDELDAAGGAFMDTAAVIANLDLVIAVDTAIAHLAGAMGAAVWVPLQFAPDWRWRTRGEATPWYPSMRLFRQRAVDDWAGVFAVIGRELAGLVAR